MSREQDQENKCDRVRDADHTVITSSKVSAESVSEETQAQRYEPRFKSFTGVGDQQLPMQGDHSARQFVLEDRDQGKEYTAQGERHIARKSFIEGLNAALQTAKSPEEEAQVRALFSIDYIVRKAERFFEAAQSAVSTFEKIVLPGNYSNQNRAEISTPSEVGATAAKQAMESITSRQFDTADHSGGLKETFTRPIPPIGPPEGDVRFADTDFADKVLFGLKDLPKTTAPPHIFAVSAHGVPGGVIHAPLGIALDGKDEIPFKEFDERLRIGMQKHRASYPDAPPLVVLAICDGGSTPINEPSLAAKVANSRNLFVLAAPGQVDRDNGQMYRGYDESKEYRPIYTTKGYLLFNPQGKVIYTMKQPITAQEWANVERLAKGEPL